MANRTDCIEKSALKSITLTQSFCELFVTELPVGNGRIVIALERELVEDFEYADKNTDFTILTNLNVTGYVPNSEDKVFDAECVTSAKFGVISDVQISRDELKHSMDSFTKLLYPYTRNIIVDQMAKMGINGLDAPWDMSNSLSNNEDETVKQALSKKKSSKRKATKKKVSKKV